MEFRAACFLLGSGSLLLSCASESISLAPVGPYPLVAHLETHSTAKGHLQVFTRTEEYYEDQMSYFPHSDYQIFRSNGTRLKRVWNHQSHQDEHPAVVPLPPGTYVVKAWAEYYGLVSVPVVIRSRQTTVLVLQPGWKPGKNVASSALVQIPNGYFVGWRADQPTAP